MAAPETPLATGGVALPPSEEKLRALFDNSIWYALSLWPILHVAVQNGWGGPDSGDKRDWFAGAVSDLFTERPDTDQDDLEVFLLQIMQDEFDVNVEDESEVTVAMSILGLKKTLSEGDLSAAQELERRWRNRGTMKSEVQLVDGEIEGDEDELDDMDEEGDTEMVEAPVATPRVKPVPEIDDDGFTKVTSKKKR